jgi:NTE family protein
MSKGKNSTKKIRTRARSSEDDSAEFADETESFGSSGNTTEQSRGVRSIKDIKNLVIGGGGTAGYCYMGAMREVFDESDEDKPSLSNVNNYIGTSAGSIVTAILSCTTDQDYLLNKFESFDVSALQDNSFGIIVDLYRLYSKYGYNKGRYALSIAREVMEELTGNPNITFAEHYELTSNNLVITGTNTTTRQITYFNRLSHPDMEVALAIRISMSLPLIFVPIKYENQRFTNILGEEGLYVDGGVIDNLPAHFVLTDIFKLLNKEGEVTDDEIEDALKALYNLEDRHDCAEMSTDEFQTYRAKQLRETIAIKSFSKETMSNISPGTNKLAVNPNRSIVKFCSNLISIFMDNGLKSHITADIWDRTLKIDVGDLSTTDFDITDEDIQNMLAIGKSAGTDFIEGR